jgi:hypothetical protein
MVAIMAKDNFAQPRRANGFHPLPIYTISSKTRRESVRLSSVVDRLHLHMQTIALSVMK